MSKVKQFLNMNNLGKALSARLTEGLQCTLSESPPWTGPPPVNCANRISMPRCNESPIQYDLSHHRSLQIFPFFCCSREPWPGFLNMVPKVWQGHDTPRASATFSFKHSSINAPCSHKPGFHTEQNTTAAGFSSY